ncbi:expressed unknown protein [Seminavis robusta]|uniref:SnoaL-like domain-containing protein n=1 Tax=Seminavis robusta TaxID=568900 RepID=A0A9N8GZW3_9STRA|nr:expressed unknown protein [Seminavis robusta]|eukprot:Sro10_g007890.1 n/a (244) ;mRNA; f:36407-37138
MKLKNPFKSSKWNASSKNNDGEAPVAAKKDDEHSVFSASTINTASLSASSKSGRSHEKKKKGSSGKKSKSSKTKPPSSIPQEVEEFKTANETVVAGLIDVINGHGTAEEMASFFKSGDIRVKFEDAPSITAAMFTGVVKMLHGSFPDFRLQYESIKEDRSGVVLVEELRASGTHTGEPFGFAHFPPIPASHKHVINDPERMWFKVRDGKIVDIECLSLGDLTGPPGFYLQLGGKMDMPPPSED